LLQTYLHILKFESLNATSPSLFLNPWRLSLKDIFPNIHFKNTSNISNIFSPSFTRVLFVRHPFERLASAYKERIAILAKDRIQPEPYYDIIRKMICRRFTRFDSAQNLLPRRNQCDDFIPSFENFVRYILMNTETPVGVARMDGHWQPYAVVCQVCKFKYNFIGKSETFNDDFTSLLKRLNVSDWNNQKRRGASGHTIQDYQQLFSSLPDDLICRLKRLYSDDFHLFNYRLEDYVNRTTLVCS
jgi:chondroitin 4-sulfotransferase 11